MEFMEVVEYYIECMNRMYMNEEKRECEQLMEQLIKEQRREIEKDEFNSLFRRIGRINGEKEDGLKVEVQIDELHSTLTQKGEWRY